MASSLNGAIRFESCLRDGTQKFPTESKPRLLTAMRDAEDFFNDDTTGFFNQIFLHPSEIWKTSVRSARAPPALHLSSACEPVLACCFT